MTKLIYTVFIILVISACSSDDAYDSRVLMAESLISEKPDSALALIESVDDSTIHSDNNRALKALVLTHARYKVYIDETSDSLISSAVDYYTFHPDKRRLMLALFLRGQLKKNGNNLSSAMIDLLKAEELAKEIDDYFHLGQIYRCLSIIYANILNGPRQIEYSIKSVDAFRSYGDSTHYFYAKSDLANSYNNNGEYDRCIALSDSVIAYADSIGNENMLTFAYMNKATSLFALARFREAADVYGKAWQLDPKSMTPLMRENMILACRKDSFKTYGADSIVLDNKRLFEEMAAIGNYKMAYDSLLAEYREIVKYSWETTKQTVSSTETNYMQMRRLQLQESNQKLTILLIFGCTAAVLVIIILVLFYKLRLKTLHARESDAIAQLTKLSKNLNTASARLADANEKVNNLFAARFATINNLCDEYYACYDSGKEQRQIFDKVKKLFAELSSDQTSYHDMIFYVNRYKDGLIDDLTEAFPKLKQSDIYLYIFCVLGFSSRSISILMSEKIEVVYNRKSRLKSRLGEAVNRNGLEFRSFI